MLSWATKSSIRNSLMRSDRGEGFSSNPLCPFILGVLFQVVISVVL